MIKSGWSKLLILSILLSLNYLALSQTYKVNGDAVDFGNGLVRLTSSTPAKGAGVWQTASAWSTTQHDLTKPFDMTFNMFFGCESGANGGDGITFTFQSEGLNALGAGGGFLGIGGSPTEMITPSISIEFDTYDASAFGAGNEIAADHIAIDINGDVNGTSNSFLGTNGMTTVQAVNNGRDLESCAQNANDYYTVRIVWNPIDHTLKLYEEGILTMTYTKDLIATIFGGNPNVYWGFTSATGSASNEQWIAPEGALIPWECTSGTSCCAPFTITPTGPTTICNTPITIGIAGTYNSYKWSTGESTSSINVTAPGSYVVTVIQDQSGAMCPAIDTIEILPTGPTAVLSGGATLCNDGSTTTLSVALNGTAPWSLSYSKDGIEQPAITGINSSPYTFQATAPHKYALSSVIDNSGCPGAVSGTANVNIYAGLPIGHDTTFLAPGNAELKVTNEGGIYQWYDAATGGNLVHTGDNFTTPTLTGVTTYYVKNASLPAFTTKSVSLLNQAEGNGPAPNDINSGGLPKADLWVNFTANDNFTFDTVTCAVNIVLPWQNSKVSVTIQDITAGTSVTIDSLVTLALPSGIQNIEIPLHYSCIAGHNYRISYEGQNSTGGLGGSIKGIMYWQLVASYPITTDPELSITGSGAPATRYPGLFDWKISYGSPSSVCGLTPVTAYPCPTGILSGNATICNDGISTTTLTVNLTGNSPWTISYSIDGITQNPITGINQNPYTFQSAKGAHVYALTSVSNNLSSGCINNFSGTATVTIYQDFPVGHDATFISPGSANLSVDDNGGTYEWYDAATGGNLVHTGTLFTTPVLNDTTIYYVENKFATVNCGRTPVTAFPISPVIAISIPNLITPNNDGYNDSFEIVGLPKHCELKIFNRWGKGVYNNSNYDNLWKANDTSDGMYYYDLILPDGKTYKGWLNIVR